MVERERVERVLHGWRRGRDGLTLLGKERKRLDHIFCSKSYNALSLLLHGLACQLNSAKLYLRYAIIQ